jgi:hypothetical protein
MKLFAKTTAAGLVALGLVLGVAPAAFAGTVTTTTSTTTVPTTSQNYQSQLAAYQVARASYRASVTVIDATFNRAIDSAHTAYSAALKANATKAGELSAQANLDLAVAQAVAVRSASLKSLGAPPVKPVNPASRSKSNNESSKGTLAVSSATENHRGDGNQTLAPTSITLGASSVLVPAAVTTVVGGRKSL